MAQERIEDRLKQMIARRLFLKIDPSAIEEDKSLVAGYGVDSTSLLELVVGIEEEFGISVPDEDFNIKHFESVSSLAAFVRSKLAAGA